MADARTPLTWEDTPGRRVELTLWRLREDGTLEVLESWRGLDASTHAAWRTLDAGHYYLWRIGVPETEDVAAGTWHASAWFRVQTTEEAQAFAAAREAVAFQRRAIPAASDALDVLEILTLEQHGFLADAERAWRDLAERAPASRTLLAARAARLAGRALDVPRRLVRGALPEGVDVPLCSPPDPGAPVP